MLEIPEQVNVASKDGNKAVVEIGPLMPGFGATIANPLRRVLLSSLQGTAITSIKIKGVDHEFSSIPGVMEDVIQVILNLKKVRFTGYTDDPVELSLSVKGEKTVTAGDIKLTSDVELINPEQVLFTMSDKKASVEMDITVQKGRGYVAVEARQRDKLPIGVIAIDAIYSPVRKVNFSIEDVRVGDRIDYNKIVMEVETDGSMEPEAAVKEAARILTDHFTMVQTVPVPEPKEKPAAKKTAAKKTKKKKE